MNDAGFPAHAATSPARGWGAAERAPAVRVVAAAAYEVPADLPRLLAGDDAPALVLVAPPVAEAEVLPFLRPQDDLARAGDDARSLALRVERLQARQRSAAELAQRRAHVDPLTGLPDRLRCLEWFSVDENAWAPDRVRALLMFDLDYFQRFNDAHGREGGDRILVDIAQRIEALAHAGDLVFRLEFDEFVVVMERPSREALIRDAHAFHALVRTAGWDDARVTASAGLAFLRPSGFRYGALQQAEAAMYMAKILGRDTLVLHDDVRQLASAHGTTLELADLSEQAVAAKARLATMADELNRRLLAEAQRQATVDPLTQVHNRRYLDGRLPREMEMAARERRPLSLVFLDIDDFRLVNHDHGHPTGDIALRRFMEVVGTCIRGGDWVARYGGEEFCLVMQVGTAEAGRVAERIRGAVAGATFTTLAGKPLAITASAGVVTFDPERDRDPAHFVDRASKANRAAKDAGKNRVVVA